MYAIVEISGKQFKVEKKQKLFVNRINTEEGKKVSFDNVLMFSDGNKLSIGSPTVSGVKVDAKVLKHLKSDKVIVFKKKRRKGYKVRNGHRQLITQIEINDIISGVSKKSSSEKKEVKKQTVKSAVKENKQDLSKLSVAELKKIASEKGVSGVSSLKKADLIKKLS
ncbi:MAG: 50S ribosomal protein L21 [Flavobacteriaceae bacterium]|nr:50S ribosomal protein L21 [Flavobacteriaceae bacterium]|tara:strand:- start:28975 stop:29472 length:498 start_codon:yes stop_codon:yes gene_type:complete